MADPLSIVTGVLALLQATGTVTNELRKLHDGATAVHSTISQLQHDVESLQMVLESMRKAFEHITAEQSTGHIGSLWDSVARSVVDGKQSLEQLHSLIAEMNKDTKFLDEYRKQLRLMRSEEKISRSRLHIQSCRDTLQLSLQTIILVNQHSFKTIAEDQVVPSLTELQKDVHRIAHRLNDAINTPQNSGLSHEDKADQTTMKTLLACVRSAASVISDASTAVPSDKGAGVSRYGSNATNFLPPHRGLAMRRWFDSRTVYSYVDAEYGPAVPPESVAEIPALDNDAVDDDDCSVDSDTESQNEMARLLLESGKRKLADGNLRVAEKLLLNSLDKSKASGGENRQGTKMQLEAIDTLYDLYVDQDKLAKAEDMLLRRMAIRERATATSSLDSLSDVLALAKLSKQQDKSAAAHLHGRRALKGYRKLRRTQETRSCLVLLITLCRADDNESDLEAYGMMLDALETASNEAPDAVPAQENPAEESSENHAPAAEPILRKAMPVSSVLEQEATTVTDRFEDLSSRNRSFSFDFDGEGMMSPGALSTGRDRPTESSVKPWTIPHVGESREPGEEAHRENHITQSDSLGKVGASPSQTSAHSNQDSQGRRSSATMTPDRTLHDPDTVDFSYEDALERQDNTGPPLRAPPKTPVCAEEEANPEKEFLRISYDTKQDWYVRYIRLTGAKRWSMLSKRQM